MAGSKKPPEGEPVVPIEPVDGPVMPGTPVDEPALEQLTKPELLDEAEHRGVDLAELDGSGADGRVIKEDLVDAIAETPQPPAGRPPLHLVAEAAAILPNPPTEG